MQSEDRKKRLQLLKKRKQILIKGIQGGGGGGALSSRQNLPSSDPHHHPPATSSSTTSSYYNPPAVSQQPLHPQQQQQQSLPPPTQTLTLACFINQFQIPSKPSVVRYEKQTQFNNIEQAPSSSSRKPSQDIDFISDQEDRNFNRHLHHHHHHPRATVIEKKFKSEIDSPNKKDQQEQAKQVQMTKEEIRNVLDSKEFQYFFDNSSCLMEKVLGSQYFDPFSGINDNNSDDEDDQHGAGKKGIGIQLQSKYFEQDFKRIITSIDWAPKKEEYFLASYSRGALVTEPDGLVQVWSLLMKKRPEISLKFHSQVTSVMFDPFSNNNNIVVGGTYSGYVVIWDTRSGSKPVKRTSIATAGHSQPIYSLAVVGTSASRNIVSLSNDGNLCTWAMEMLNAPQSHFDLKYTPSLSGAGIENIQKSGTPGSSLTSSQSQTSSQSIQVAANCLVFPQDETNNFYVGSVDGHIYHSQLHSKNYQTVIGQYNDHQAPVLSLSAHPHQSGLKSSQISNLILSSSMDWTVRLWNPKKYNRSIRTFESAQDYIYDVQWSPTHPSIFASCDGEGNIDIWDIVKDIEAPFLKHKAEISAIHKLKWDNDGRKILTGNSVGQLAVWSVDKQITQPRPDDFQKFEMIIEV